MKQMNKVTGYAEEQKLARVYPGMDFLKIVLAILIIARHCGQIYYRGDIDHLYYTYLVNGLSTAGVPTFFCISGFLFYQRESSAKRLKKQIGRLLKLYLVWSIIFFPVSVRSWECDGKLINHLLQYLQNAFFSGTYYHLWYLTALIVALLLTGFGRGRVNKKTACIAVILFIIGLLGNSYSVITRLFAERELTLYTKVFLTTRNGLFVGVPCVLLGKFLAESQEACVGFSQKYKNVFCVGILVSILLLMAESYFLYIMCHNTINDILMTDILFAICAFMIFIGIDRVVEENKLIFCRKMSTFIYCCHPLVIRAIYVAGEWIGIWTNVVCYTIVSIIATFTFSCLVVCLSKKIKLLNIFY